jgi:Lrp/AsnC family leucine-responsive transcriptional regulator
LRASRLFPEDPSEVLNAFNRFHSEKIIALPGVCQVRAFFVLDEIKADAPLPI